MQGPVDGPRSHVGDADIYSLVPKDTYCPISALAEDSMLLPHTGPSGSATLAVCPAGLLLSWSLRSPSVPQAWP